MMFGGLWISARTSVHAFVDQDDSSADHIWRLSTRERENLRKYLSLGRG